MPGMGMEGMIVEATAGGRNLGPFRVLAGTEVVI